MVYSERLIVTAGFYRGVRRAVNLVLAELKKGNKPFVVYGELVHNPQVLETLEDKDVGICSKPEPPVKLVPIDLRIGWIRLEEST